MGITIPLFSESENIIESVRIIGLMRTKPNTAERPLRQFIGAEAGELDANKVIAAIMEQGILEPVSVSVEENTLVVEVKEKWTLLPLPIFFADSGGASGGLFLSDTNAFGLNHNLVLGGIFSDNRWLANAMYMVPPGGRYNLGWSISAFFSDGERRNSDEKDNTLRFYKSQSLSASVSLRHNINHILSASVSLSYTDITLKNLSFTINEPDSGIQFIRSSFGISARRTNWDGYFLSAQSAAFQYSLISDFDFELLHTFSFRGIYEKSIIPGFRISSRSGAIYRPDSPALLEGGPGDSGVNFFPRSFSARHYAGLSLGLEKSLYRFSLGTISAFGAWQMAYSNGPFLGGRFDYGTAFSLHFYMNRLAIPALGFGIAYNIPSEYYQFSINMGMSF